MNVQRRSKCIACSVGQESNRLFFRLPSNIERCNKWLALCQREDLVGASQKTLEPLRVCSQHFKEVDIALRSHRLIKNATPIPVKDESPAPALGEDDPLLEPFTHGWRRELVHRGGDTSLDGSRIRSDCYYYTPAGKKLRSMREIQSVLADSRSWLSVNCFTLQRRLLGVGPAYETERQAGTGQPNGAHRAEWPAPGHSSAQRDNKRRREKRHGLTKEERRVVEDTLSRVVQRAAGQKRSPSAVQARKSAVEARRAERIRKAAARRENSASSAANVAPKLLKILTKGRDDGAFLTAELAQPKRRLKLMVKGQPACPAAEPAAGAAACAGWVSAAALRRLVSTRPWRLAVVQPDGEVETHDEPGKRTVWRRAYQRQLRGQAPSETPQPLQIGQVRQYSACSLFCPRAEPEEGLVLPSVQCLACCCLSHPACVGLQQTAAPGDFICLDCYDKLRHREDRTLPAAEARSGRTDATDDSSDEVVIVSDGDASDGAPAGRSALDHDWGGLATARDEGSGPSDAEPAEMSPPSLWSALYRPANAGSSGASPSGSGAGMRGPPSLVRGGRPPSLVRGPRPPPLQRAPVPRPEAASHQPATTDSAPAAILPALTAARPAAPPAANKVTVVVNRVAVSRVAPAAGQTKPALPAPAAPVSGTRTSGVRLIASRSFTSPSGCRVRFSGPAGSRPPALSGPGGPAGRPSVLSDPGGPVRPSAAPPATIRLLSPDRTDAARVSGVDASRGGAGEPRVSDAGVVGVSGADSRVASTSGSPVPGASRVSGGVRGVAPTGTYCIRKVAVRPGAASGVHVVRTGARKTVSGQVAVRRTVDSAPPPPPKVSPASAAGAQARHQSSGRPGLIKVTVKCTPRTNGHNTTVVVSRSPEQKRTGETPGEAADKPVTRALKRAATEAPARVVKKRSWKSPDE